jgi:DNA-binding PadR family transcriptional regulator
MIDSYTDQILVREFESRRGVQTPRVAVSALPMEGRTAIPNVMAEQKVQGVSNMYGRGCGSWFRGGMAAGFMGGGFPFGRGGRWGRFFGPGEIRLSLLSLLESGPKHGYELMKELESKSGGIYKASAGAIYPALQQLEDEGLVTSDQPTGKRTYSLTDAGRAELQREAETVKKIWQRAEQAGDWAPWMGMEGAEVMRPAAEVMKTALRAATRGSHDSARIAKIREILERTKRELDSLEK